jgi:hypothetical protein
VQQSQLIGLKCLMGVRSVQTLSRSHDVRRRGSGGNHSVLEKDPVSCALMSGLLRGACRWPSWVCAYVSGTNLSGGLEAPGC